MRWWHLIPAWRICQR